MTDKMLAFAALPRSEIVFYFLVTVLNILYAWWCAVSYSWKYNLGQNRNIHESDCWPFVGLRQRDYADHEWSIMRVWLRRSVFWYLGHVILFNMLRKCLQKDHWRFTMLIYWLLATSFIFSIKAVIASLGMGLVIALAVWINPKWYILWGVGGSLLYSLIWHHSFSAVSGIACNLFHEFILVCYCPIVFREGTFRFLLDFSTLSAYSSAQEGRMGSDVSSTRQSVE